MIRQAYYYLKLRRAAPQNIAYFGEFGYELIAVIPYAYYLYTTQKLAATHACQDTADFYYFSPHHQETNSPRSYQLPDNVPIVNIHIRYLPRLLWEPPPYKEYFSNAEFVFDKPLCIVCNKYNTEWGFEPITYLDIPTLDQLFDTLTPHYQVVYCRPTASQIPEDNSTIYDLGDHDWIRQHYPSIILIQDLHKENPHYTFNQLQLKLFANANHFISIQGGYSILCSYFKGTNIVYGAKSPQRTADEIVYKAYDRWYHHFSGATVLYTDTYHNLLTTTTTHFSPTTA